MSASKDSTEKPWLIHPSLYRIPQPIRFSAQGTFQIVLFTVIYTVLVGVLEPLGFAASAIYAGVSIALIPVGHFTSCIFVFGWPAPGRYLWSLAGCAPIGFTSMAIGTAATAYLEDIDFDTQSYLYMKENARFLLWNDDLGEDDEALSGIQGTYSTLVVTVITSLWSYVFTTLVMSQPSPKKDDIKKEL